MSIQLDNCTALITGASSGIGYCYALELAKRGAKHLVLVARRENRLEELAKSIETLSPSCKTSVIPCDLRESTKREKLLAKVEEQNLSIDILINNAGYGSLGAFSTSDPEWEQNMVVLNCIAPMHLSRLLIPQMTERKNGAIVNVCSTAAFQPMPYMTTYGASKSFLLSFSVALAQELKKTGIHVMAHCPGPTESEFHLVVGLEDKLSYINSMSTEQVVLQALDALENKKTILINGLLNKAMANLNRLLPRPLTAKLVQTALKGAR